MSILDRTRRGDPLDALRSGRGVAGTGRVGRTISAAILLVLVIAALAPSILAPGDPFAIAPTDAFSPPVWGHPFGTDESGRDIYTRVVHGARESLVIALAATAIGIGLAIPLGAAASSRWRWLAVIAGRLMEVLFAVPTLLLALVFIALVGPGVLTSTVAVGLSTAPGYARIIRGRITEVRGAAFVESSVVLGRSTPGLWRRHIVPHSVGIVVVLASLGLGQAVIWASALSFLGLGAAPPSPEWGAMLSSGRTYITFAWWMTVFPALAVVITAAAATILGRGIGKGVVER